MVNFFGNVYGRLCICEWCGQICKISAEEQKFFWSRIQREVCRFCDLSGFNNNNNCQRYKASNLYSVRSYAWSLGGEPFIFMIGLNPRRSFQVEIILEKEKSSTYVELNSIILNELFDAIRKIYQPNACHPEFDTSEASSSGCIHIGAYGYELYKLSINNRSMSMNDKNLLALIDLQPWIVEILQIYEFERVKAETSLFRLLGVFSSKNKEVQRSELIELITAPCSHVPVEFIIEMGTQHYNLLKHLLMAYQEIRMIFKNTSTCALNENESNTL